MFTADRFHFRVGDRVRDRQTQKEGRVVDLAHLTQNAVLVTVAFFVGSHLLRKRQFKVVSGGVGSPIVNIGPDPVGKAADASSRDLRSGTPSARAKEAALRNAPTSEERLLAERQAMGYRMPLPDDIIPDAHVGGTPNSVITPRKLKNAEDAVREQRRRAFTHRTRGLTTPAGVPFQFETVEQLLNRVNTTSLEWDEREKLLSQIIEAQDDLTRSSAWVAQESKGTRRLLAKLSQSASKVGGRWQGGVLNDILLQGHSPAYVGELQTLFQDTLITERLRSKYNLPAGINNAFELYTQFQSEIQGQLRESWNRGVPAPFSQIRSRWQNFQAPVLRELVREGHFQTRDLGNIREALDLVRPRLTEARQLLSDPGVIEALQHTTGTEEFSANLGLNLGQRFGREAYEEFDGMVIGDYVPDDAYENYRRGVQRQYKLGIVSAPKGWQTPGDLNRFLGKNEWGEYEYLGKPLDYQGQTYRVQAFEYAREAEPIKIAGSYPTSRILDADAPTRRFSYGVRESTPGGLRAVRLRPTASTEQLFFQLPAALESGSYQPTVNLDGQVAAYQEHQYQLLRKRLGLTGEELPGSIERRLQSMVTPSLLDSVRSSVDPEEIRNIAYVQFEEEVKKISQSQFLPHDNEVVINAALGQTKKNLGDAVRGYLGNPREVEAGSLNFTNEDGSVVDFLEERVAVDASIHERTMAGLGGIDNPAAYKNLYAANEVAQHTEAIIAELEAENKLFARIVEASQDLPLSKYLQLPPEEREFLEAEAARIEERLLFIEELKGMSASDLRRIMGIEVGGLVDPSSEQAAKVARQIMLDHQSSAALDDLLERINVHKEMSLVEQFPELFAPAGGGEWGALVTNAKGKQFLYQSSDRWREDNLARMPGVARGLRDPSHIVALTGDDIWISEQEYLRAQMRQAAQPYGQGAAATISQGPARAAAIAEQVAPTNPGSLFQAPGGKVIGFMGKDGISPQKVLQNTQRLFEERKNFVFLDIENSKETGKISNVFAQEYSWEGGKLVGGKSLHLATGVKAAETGLEAVSEKELLRQTAAFIAERPTQLVAGHNISHDAGSLLKRAGDLKISKAGQTTLRNALQERLADSIVAANAAELDASSLALEHMRRVLVSPFDEAGNLYKQVHLAKPDIRDNAAVLQELADNHSDTITKNLRGAVDITPDVGSYFWDTGGGKDRVGRAYRYLGMMEQEAVERVVAGTVFDPEQTVGFLAEPIDFVTKQGTGRRDAFLYKTPAGMGSVFEGRFKFGSQQEILDRMAPRVADLAGRRVRRSIVGGTDNHSAFEMFLLERERVNVARAAGATNDLGAAQYYLNQQLAASREGSLRRQILQDVNQWAQKELPDSRIAAQLQAMQPWLEDMIQKQEPLISALERIAEGSPEALRPQVMKSVSRVWESFQGLTEELSPIPYQSDVVISPEDQKLTFEVPYLRSKKTVRIVDAQSAQVDLHRITGDIARKMAKENRAEVVAMFDGQDRHLVGQLLNNATPERINLFLEHRVGQVLKDRIWEQHLQPALEQGSVVVRESTEGVPLQITGLTREAAIQQMVTEGPAHAQSLAERIPDYLTPRDWTEAQLEELGRRQNKIVQKLGTPEGAERFFQNLMDHENWTFREGHGVSEDLFGHSVADYVRRNAASNESREGMIDTLRRMVPEDLSEGMKLRNLIRETDPQGTLGRYIFGGDNSYKSFRPAAFQKVVSPPSTRQFQVGGLAGIGEEMANYIKENRSTLRSGGLAALAIGGVALGMMALNSPTPPTPHNDIPPDHRPNPETPNPQYKKPTRVRVTVEGEATDAYDHNRLTEAVHQVIGRHLNLPTKAPQASVQDNRQPVSRNYLMELAGQLMQPLTGR